MEEKNARFRHEAAADGQQNEQADAIEKCERPLESSLDGNQYECDDT